MTNKQPNNDFFKKITLNKQHYLKKVSKILFFLVVSHFLPVSLFCFIIWLQIFMHKEASSLISLLYIVYFEFLLYNVLNTVRNIGRHSRAQFNDPSFVFHDSSWHFHDPYFCRKHIHHESYKVNRTQDYGLKICKQVTNYLTLSWFWKQSYWQFPASIISSLSKRKEQTEKMRQLTNQVFTNWFTLMPKEHSVKSYNTKKIDLYCSMEIYNFVQLL